MSDSDKALTATVRTFPRSAYDLAGLLTGLGAGEAVVTVLGERGAPTPVAAVRLRAPESLMGPSDPAALDRAVRDSPLHERCAQAVDRESAYERLTAARAEADAGKEARPADGPGREAPEPRKAASRKAAPREEPSMVEQVVGGGVFESLARSVGTQLGRAGDHPLPVRDGAATAVARWRRSPGTAGGSPVATSSPPSSPACTRGPGPGSPGR